MYVVFIWHTKMSFFDWCKCKVLAICCMECIVIAYWSIPLALHSEIKVFPDDGNVAKMIKIVDERVKTLWEKDAGYLNFLIFTTILRKACFFKAVKTSECVVQG